MFDTLADAWEDCLNNFTVPPSLLEEEAKAIFFAGAAAMISIAWNVGMLPVRKEIETMIGQPAFSGINIT